MRFVLFAVFVGMTAGAFATTLPRTPIEILLKNSDVVAVVSIQSGKINGDCGAVYRGNVLAAIKGVSKGQTIEFGPYIGEKIGGKYLLFLSGPGHEFDPHASDNSRAIKARAEFEKRCKGKFPKYRVTFEGEGAVDIGQPIQLQFADAAQIPTKWIGLPESLQTLKWSPFDTSIDGAYVWVREADLIKYLQGVANSSGN